mgnify:CR=1 FL=1
MSPKASPIRPVEKQSMDAVVAKRLREAILDGSLPLGTRLTEIDLAASLAISRSTVRAGLKQLLSEGLVVLQPYTGWHVLTLNARDAYELFSLRSCLESLASYLAAENINDDGRIQLNGAFKALKDAVHSANDRAITDADLALHKTIIDLSRHNRLRAHYALVEQQFRILIASSNAMLKRRSMIVKNHRELVDAICLGEASKAEALARNHGSIMANALVAALQP